MSHHFAQMCARSFFLVQVVRCLDAGSCSLIVSHDCLQSFLDKVLRGEAVYGRWRGNNLVTRQKAIYGGVSGDYVVTAVLGVAFILVPLMYNHIMQHKLLQCWSTQCGLC